ncbi:hypothetical protein [Marinovum algicola]|nr:hypothetical protein [Marinovum algicola]
MKLSQWSSANQRAKLMFDYLPTEDRDPSLDLARCFFSDHGQDLADAAARLGGACGNARVVSCALQIKTACRMNHRIRRDLVALHRLLSLEDVGDPACLETELFGALHPANPQVETICVLTDMLSNLLTQIDSSLASRAYSEGEGNSAAA